MSSLTRPSRPNTAQKEDIAKNVSVDGTNMVQMKFKESGIILRVTPFISSDGMVEMIRGFRRVMPTTPALDAE